MLTDGLKVNFMRRILLLLTALLLLLTGGILLWHGNGCRIVGNRLCTQKTTQLDLSGQTLPALEELMDLPALQTLNLQNTGLTPAQYDILQAALPQCQILWSVPFQGGFYPQDTRHLSIQSMAQEDYPILSYFPQLKTLDANGCTDADTLIRLQEVLPACDISYSVLLNGKRQPEDTQHLTLGGDSVIALANALRLLPLVEEVDATQCLDYAGLLQLQQQYPHINIHYQLALSGATAQEKATELKLTNPQLGELKAALAYLPSLKKVELAGQLPDMEQLHNLQLQYPQVEFLWSVSMFGATFRTNAERLDLSDHKITDLAALEQVLTCMPRLNKVELHNCDIASEDIAALAQRFPQIRFVWTIYVGGISVRTDATTLMPFQYGVTLTDQDTAQLRYCTDMVCMDLGHQKISDVSFLAFMPKLQYLTLAENPVEDISPLAGLKELVFLELFLTNVRDYSPLLSCPKLQDLNISYAIPNDMSVLTQLKQLRHLHLKGLWQDSFQEQLEQALPNTNLVFAGTGDISSTGDGWRKLENYFRMRDLLNMPYMTY